MRRAESGRFASAGGSPAALFPGGGQLGELVRGFDWASTPVGPMESWPESLRTALRIVLNSRYPMFIWWGPSLTTFYNDAYVPVLGEKHPAALGGSGRDTWAEIWDVLGPFEEAVFARAEANYSEELLLVMERHGFKEETYFTFSYSPILEADGRVAGLFCACTEDTSRVIAARRMRALRELADGTAAARSPEDAVRAAADALAVYDHDLPFTAFFLLDDDGTTARGIAATGLEPGTEACPAVVPLDDPAAPDPWQLRAVRDAGVPLVCDLRARATAPRCGPWDEPAATALVLPLARAGADRLAGFAVVGTSPRLAFDGDYRAFCELVAGHVATGVANARAWAEERRRAEALAELDRAKTVFFSNVSHEFRTPLTLMLGPLEDLRRAALGDAEREWAAIAHRNGLRLLRLVNDLLEFSRIEAGRVDAKYEPVDLASYTADLASVFRAATERAGLALDITCPPVRAPVFVDHAMWEKVVLNLLSNAFKFTLAGRIAVEVREGDGSVTLAVSDTGVGIPPDELPHVFERFRRGTETRGRSQEGTGIGLALVQELVRLHGGTVAVESMLGRGSTFTVTIPTGATHLPAGRVQAGPARSASGVGAGPWVEEALGWLPESRDVPAAVGPARARGTVRTAGARLLVADDNADMRAYLRRLLGEHWQIDAVADGAAALAAVRTRRPDLVLADVMMPGVDGFALVRALRDDPATRGLPIVLLSARAGEEARVEGLAAGADDYIVKPFSARELVAAIDARLELARVRAAAAGALQVAEERYRSLIGLVSSVVWIADKDGIVPEQNPSWEAIAGQAHGEYQGIGWIAAPHPDDRERVLHEWNQAVASGEEYFTTYRVRHEESGEYHHVEARALPLRDDDGRIREWIGMIADVDERRRATEALEEANARKDEFLAMLAHELRNPLAPIQNATRLLSVVAPPEPRLVRACEIIDRQVSHLTRLVDDLLDVSRITRGKVVLQKEVVALGSIVEAAVETVRPAVERLGHTLQVTIANDADRLLGDFARLVQVVSNLLTNAAKFTPARGRIELLAGRDGNTVTISVRDNGVGIAPELQMKIFDLFVQDETGLARTQGGLGIGLTVVKRLVEMHGGRVRVRSEGLGHGAEFVVDLPADPPAMPLVRSRPDAAVAPGRRLAILIVEDNPDAAESFAMLLRLGGHDVRVAANGFAALELVERFAPDVAFLDIGLPGIDGYELSGRLRARASCRRTVLVAMTGYGRDEDKQRAIDAGFDRHLTKPVEHGEVARVLASVELPTASPASNG